MSKSFQLPADAGSSRWLPEVYEELRRLAAARMAREADGLTLQPTALVHEAWIKLTLRDDRKWNNREHFFRSAAARPCNRAWSTAGPSKPCPSPCPRHPLRPRSSSG